MEILDTSWAVPQADSKYDLHELGEPSLCLRAFSFGDDREKRKMRMDGSTVQIKKKTSHQIKRGFLLIEKLIFTIFCVHIGISLWWCGSLTNVDVLVIGPSNGFP